MSDQNFANEPDDDGVTDIPDEDENRPEPESRRWFLYKPELFVRAGYGTLEDDFIAAVNPTDCEIRADIGLGVEPAQHVRLYRLLVPERKQASQRIIQEKLSNAIPLEPWLVYTRIIWAPAAKVLIPKVWRRALRHEVDGRVMSGQLPFILFDAETDETAPALDECLQFQPPGPARPRSTSRVASRVARPRSKP